MSFTARPLTRASHHADLMGLGLLQWQVALRQQALTPSGRQRNSLGPWDCDPLLGPFLLLACRSLALRPDRKELDA
jgi:hypothetical protein